MLDRIVKVIDSCRIFLLTSHIRLDGDALGSELAMYHILRDMGKEVVVYNQDETPENYRFLPGSKIIVNTLEPVEDFDAVFVLDCSEIDRIGNEASRVASIKRMINMKTIMPKHAVISAFLGQTKDRFHQYNEVRGLDDKLLLASQIPGISGIEAVFPYEVNDAPGLVASLQQHNLSLSAINVNVKAEPEFRDGGLTSTDKAVRGKAVRFIK